ncbi:MAG: TPM domain-containing protein [Oscillospiraceae bacterium]|nr:TPM domain-containing protein [Oscillospiraceae bacterium]
MNGNNIKEKYLRGNKLKLTLAKTASAMMIAAALILSLFVFDRQEAYESPGNWIYDGEGILSDMSIYEINGKNTALKDLTGRDEAEIVVVIEKENGKNKDLTKRAEKLFKDYKVSDSGMLLIISVPGSAAPVRQENPERPAANSVEEWGRKIGEFFDGLFGNGRETYAHYIGRNVDDSIKKQIKDGIENILTNNFDANYSEGNYNAATLGTFNSIINYFGEYYNIGFADSAAYQTYYTAPPVFESAEQARRQPVRLSSILITTGIILIGFGVSGIFKSGGKNKKVSRVYRNPAWFGN